MGRGSITVIVNVGRGSVAVIVNVGRGRAAVRMSDPQSREPKFKSSCCRFKALAIVFIPRCHSSLSCINEYLAADRGGYLNE